MVLIPDNLESPYKSDSEDANSGNATIEATNDSIPTSSSQNLIQRLCKLEGCYRGGIVGYERL